MLKNIICLFLILLSGLNLWAQDESSPVKDLKSLYSNNEEFKKTVDLMLKNVHELPNGNLNPWKSKNVNDLYNFLND